MNLATVDKIAKAVLYEGYMLYPYRPSSVKNRKRWNFGVLCPPSYSEAQQGTEAWTMLTECLVEASADTALEIRVRFLQLVARSVAELAVPVPNLPEEVPEFCTVPRLEIGGRVYQPWQEAVEREVILPTCVVGTLIHAPRSQSFEFSAGRQYEYLSDDDGLVAGMVVRQQNELQGVVDLSCQQVETEVVKVSVRIRNLTRFAGAECSDREDALLSSLVSTHTVLGAQDGQFVSLLDPPSALRESASACQNLGSWPVLVGAEGQRDTLLSSPIILYDYPQIAPESAGDLFDGTEIDEILSLRIMTLTDEEKREMSQSDERARQMLERTANMPVEQLMKMHGVLRNLRPLKEETQ